jgi:tetratricopeptide (TPR) repeat protein
MSWTSGTAAQRILNISGSILISSDLSMKGIFMEKDVQLRKEEALINKGIQLLRTGKFDEAMEIFVLLDGKIPDSAVIKGLIGDTLSAAGNIKEAAKYYYVTVQLSPKSRLASLGLFHSLWDLGNIDDAIKEAIRFDFLNGNSEYVEILEEMWNNDFQYPKLKEETIDKIIEQLNHYPTAYRSKWIQDFDFDGTRATL